MKDILIIGGGWLGKPLAHYLQTIGHRVAVSRTTEAGVSEINDLLLTGTLIDLKSDVNTITTSIKSVQPDLVIGCFPQDLDPVMEKNTRDTGISWLKHVNQRMWKKS